MKKTLIQICNAEWEIREVKNRTMKRLNKGDSVDGLCNYDQQRIYINSELHPHRKKLALVHEWLHVIGDRSGLAYRDDEKIVRAYEHGVLEMVDKFYEVYDDDEG
jgi:Zn-dependent peptidase ImmA (M78 family)